MTHPQHFLGTEVAATRRKLGGPLASSLGLHVLVLLVLMTMRFGGPAQVPPESLSTILSAPLFLPSPGGGGGGRVETPASRGSLPRLSRQQITPPTTVPKSLDPELPVDPALVSHLESVPRLTLLKIGDPDGLPGAPSDGTGRRGGIGDGSDGGIGADTGPRAGAGPTGIFRVSDGVSAPVLTHKTEPEYSEEARKARFQGTVVLEVVVRRDGVPEIRRVVRNPGFGLDEAALRAVRQWRFEPGRRGKDPVDVLILVEVNYNLR